MWCRTDKEGWQLQGGPCSLVLQTSAPSLGFDVGFGIKRFSWNDMETVRPKAAEELVFRVDVSCVSFSFRKNAAGVFIYPS